MDTQDGQEHLELTRFLIEEEPTDETTSEYDLKDVDGEYSQGSENN